MSVVKQAYKTVAVDSLIEHPLNPRRGDEERIGESVEANGFYGAIIVQASTGYVLAGNHRKRAAKAAGIDKVPTIQVDVDDDVALRILLADNRTNDTATYDESQLADILSELAMVEGGLQGTGYDVDFLGELIEGIADVVAPDFPDVAPDAKKPGEAVISYVLVFENEDQQSRWHRFLRELRGQYEGETLAGKLDTFLRAREA